MDRAGRKEEDRESLASKIMRVSNDEEVRNSLFDEMEMSIYSVSQDDLDKRFTI